MRSKIQDPCPVATGLWIYAGNGELQFTFAFNEGNIGPLYVPKRWATKIVESIKGEVPEAFKVKPKRRKG
jgi:hypothetical protein